MTFDEFILRNTGRNLEYHKRAGTTGIEFAMFAWNAALDQSMNVIENYRWPIDWQVVKDINSYKVNYDV